MKLGISNFFLMNNTIVFFQRYRYHIVINHGNIKLRRYFYLKKYVPILFYCKTKTPYMCFRN